MEMNNEDNKIGCLEMIACFIFAASILFMLFLLLTSDNIGPAVDAITDSIRLMLRQ